MFLFEDNLIKEYSRNKELNKILNQGSFNWWSYINMKSDLQTALAFVKFFCPEMIEIDNCLVLKDRYVPELFNDWQSEYNDKKTTETMTNLYEIKDFFHINRNEDEDEEKQYEVLGKALQYFWSRSFKEQFPDRIIKVNLFKEYGELFITVHEDLLDN